MDSKTADIDSKTADIDTKKQLTSTPKTAHINTNTALRESKQLFETANSSSRHQTALILHERSISNIIAQVETSFPILYLVCVSTNDNVHIQLSLNL